MVNGINLDSADNIWDKSLGFSLCTAFYMISIL